MAAEVFSFPRCIRIDIPKLPSNLCDKRQSYNSEPSPAQFKLIRHSTQLNQPTYALPNITKQPKTISIS